jgi:hypothetical protein
MGNNWPLVLSLLFSPSAEAPNPASVLSPLPHERIEPLALAKRCSGVAVVEWQDGPPSGAKRQVLDAVCSLVVDKLPGFLRTRKLTAPPRLALGATVSLLNVGKGPRQLNDPVRFAALDLPKHPDGRPYVIYGYYHYAMQHVFVRSDVLAGKQPSRVFMRSFAHELFHALMNQNHLVNQLPSPVHEREEAMALDFTAYLGLGR